MILHPSHHANAWRLYHENGCITPEYYYPPSGHYYTTCIGMYSTVRVSCTNSPKLKDTYEIKDVPVAWK